MKINLKVSEITCEACIKVSQAALEDLPGVTSVAVANDGQTTVEADREINLDEINTALAEVGKKAELI